MLGYIYIYIYEFISREDVLTASEIVCIELKTQRHWLDSNIEVKVITKMSYPRTMNITWKRTRLN